jgi:ribosomal subunit interface protein
MKTFDVNNMQLKIQSPGMVLDDALETYLVSHLEKLGKTFPRIKKCEMLLREEKNGSKKNCLAEGKLFVPGHFLFASSQEDNFKIAAKNMFGDLRDQLLKVKERFADKSAILPETEKEESFD